MFKSFSCSTHKQEHAFEARVPQRTSEGEIYIYIYVVKYFYLVKFQRHDLGNIPYTLYHTGSCSNKMAQKCTQLMLQNSWLETKDFSAHAQLQEGAHMGNNMRLSVHGALPCYHGFIAKHSCVHANMHACMFVSVVLGHMHAVCSAKHSCKSI